MMKQALKSAELVTLKSKGIPPRTSQMQHELPIAKPSSQCHSPTIVESARLKINLIARTNGVGLDRDVDLVAEILKEAGHEITRSHCRDAPLWHRWRIGSARFDFNIFMERIFPRWISHASQNIIIPNQERFPERHLQLLKKIDHILCKSRHSLEIFSKHHPSCHLSSFTSKDLYQPQVPFSQNTFLHLAGRSTLKGTETILALWEKHPEWPELLLLQHKENAPKSVPPNVTLRTDYIPTDELNRIMNTHRLHLCPSLSEGWGHYIVEAMACQATVLTTDGPPMNELVTPQRGHLIKVASHDARHLGTNFMVDPADLEKIISELLQTSSPDLQNKGLLARKWFLTNDRNFRENLPRLIKSLAP